MAFSVVWPSVGYARPIHFHLVAFACPMEPNIMSWVWGELYCVSWMGHVSGEE